MSLRTLISAEQLRTLQATAQAPVLLDCSFDLTDLSAGERNFAMGHLPGAHYAHLERDLSGPKVADGPRSPRFTGRHPLPARAALAAWAGRTGIAPGVQVVAFDGQGSPYAARCWWLLRWLGHDAVAVLDGGIAAWVNAGASLVVNAPLAQTRPPYPECEPAMPVIDADGLLAALGRVQVLDARSLARFRGETEPFDPVAGHIPGATHRAFTDNLGPDGRFKPAAQLRAEFAALGMQPQHVVHQCGSGVTACHNLLAMAHAGLEGSVLYPGSWSEWCADDARPVARA